MKNDPPYSDYLRYFATSQGNIHKLPIGGRLLLDAHRAAEERFCGGHYSQVLEIGAGRGEHYDYVKHTYDRYVLSDLEPVFLENRFAKEIAEKKVEVVKVDGTKLPFEDNTFDRLIATHVLEHLLNPHLVLREWHRVVKAGGYITLILPCDPGVLWKIGRNFGPRKNALQNGHVNYDYWNAREHVNSISNLLSLIRFYFDEIDEIFHPLRIPLEDLNLSYIVSIKVKK